MESPPARPWHSASPAVSRSPGSARQAARARRADDEPAESSTASRGAAVKISTANPNGKCQYRGEWYDCAQCAREFFEVKKKVKHSSEGSCRLARQPIIVQTMVPAHNGGQPSSSSAHASKVGAALGYCGTSSNMKSDQDR